MIIVYMLLKLQPGSYKPYIIKRLWIKSEMPTYFYEEFFLKNLILYVNAKNVIFDTIQKCKIPFCTSFVVFLLKIVFEEKEKSAKFSLRL